MTRSVPTAPRGGQRSNSFRVRRGSWLGVAGAALTTASLLVFGCTANLGGVSDAVSEGLSPNSFTCNPQLVPQEAGWRRLTKRQYERTLRDVLKSTIGDAEASAVMAAAQAPFQQLPVEQRFKNPNDLHGSYRRLSQALDQGHVDNWYATALVIAAELTNEQRLPTAVGACASGVGTGTVEECLASFVERFGRFVLRRPLTKDEIAFYSGFYGSTAQFTREGFADVIGGLLNAPEFLYMVENGSDAPGSKPGSFRLNDYEIAARLSYHFWDTMPDEELFQKAAAGQLSDRAELEKQVDRMLADPKATETAREFFRDWLKLEDLPALNQLLGIPEYDAFVGDHPPSAQLRDAMINEVLDLLEYMVFREGGGLTELFTTELAYPKTEELASLYGVSAATDGPVTLPEGQRPGLLTRAAFLATGTANTRPIMKGVFIRTNLLCEPIPAPPNNVNTDSPNITETMSTRQIVEELTEQKGSSCAGCHSAQINPLGFATENFDSLGRIRAEQSLFDETGKSLGVAPVDTRTKVKIDSETYDVSGPPELMSALVESGKLEACLTRHYFRYSFGRWENLKADGCALETMREKLVQTGSISGMLREVALTPEFTERVFK